MSRSHFDVLILIGRPASGKSEIIDFLYRLPTSERARYHMSALEVAVFLNEDDVTTDKPEQLENGLEAVLDSLWGFYLQSDRAVTTRRSGPYARH